MNFFRKKPPPPPSPHTHLIHPDDSGQGSQNNYKQLWPMYSYSTPTIPGPMFSLVPYIFYGA